MQLLNKYHLKDLHHEIDFFDRKIAHCRDYQQFDCEADRAAALKKLGTKRQTLVNEATALGSQGVKCDPKYLARSLRPAPLPAGFEESK